MSTTEQDIMYENYLASLHDEYIETLENFASSRNLDELRRNLDKLNQTARKADSSVENQQLEKSLQEVATLNAVYEEILATKRSGKKQFITGSTLAIIGLLLTGISFI